MPNVSGVKEPSTFSLAFPLSPCTKVALHSARMPSCTSPLTEMSASGMVYSFPAMPLSASGRTICVVPSTVNVPLKEPT